MASVKKKNDPISDRSRALNEQIAALEAEIKKLDTQLQRTPVPKLRSTAIPHGATVARKSEMLPAPKAAARGPVFEEIIQKPYPARVEIETPDHYNKLGARKYDLPGLWERLRNHFRRPTTTNPRLVNYLAAGGVHGLRPMRYEKRVARNRFILLVVVLFLLLLGVILIFIRNH
jgi:cell division protein FtsB